jgi:thymidylate synthase (FAD)
VAYQSADNKQGRSDESLPAELAEEIRGGFEEGQKRAYGDYSDLVEQGIARELARINLPLSLYTEWYWQIDLHNLFHFLQLRLDPHAQKEIRAYAQVILEITRKVVPRSCGSFENHVLGGVRFSADELAELQRRLSETTTEVGSTKTTSLSGKALERFEEKLRKGRQL